MLLDQRGLRGDPLERAVEQAADAGAAPPVVAGVERGRVSPVVRFALERCHVSARKFTSDRGVRAAQKMRSSLLAPRAFCAVTVMMFSPFGNSRVNMLNVPSALTTARTRSPFSFAPFHEPSRTDQARMASRPARPISALAKQGPV